MIRMVLSTDDLAQLRIADTPDFGYELALAGAHLADRTVDRRLAGWRSDVARGWNHGHARLFDLYTRTYIPAFFGRAAQPTPSEIDLEAPEAAAHLRDLARSGALTPFTRALADGHHGALRTLNGILAGFRSRALDPYRRRITSAAATASATASVRAAIGGTGDMLNSLHPSIRWDGRELRLNTILDAEETLDGRRLIFQPTALATRVTFDPLADSVTVIYPAGTGPIERDPDLRTPPQALISLLGATRAAALVIVVNTPAVTTGRLAAALSVSAAAASRHATALRESGLIATVRNGQTVHHAPTRLGAELVHGSAIDDEAECGADAPRQLVMKPLHRAPAAPRPALAGS